MSKDYTQAATNAASSTKLTSTSIYSVNFADSKFTANMAELKKTDEWSRSNVIEKGGWGKVEGGQDLSPEAARACALILIPA